MATTLYLTDDAAALSGYLKASRGRGGSAQTPNTSTVAGGTYVPVTDGTGGAVLEFITKPFRAPMTIAGLITGNLRAVESASGANCAIGIRLVKLDRAGVETIFANIAASSEMNTTAGDADNAITSNPTSTDFNAGDRLILRPYLTNAGGSMTSGRTVTFGYSGPTAGTTGDTYVTFTENFLLGFPTFCR